MIGSLAKLQPNLSFRQSDLEGALLIVATSHPATGPWKWVDVEEDRDGWRKEKAYMIRCMLRHVNQARLKGNPKWLKELKLPPWNKAQREAAEKDEKELQKAEGAAKQEQAADPPPDQGASRREVEEAAAGRIEADYVDDVEEGEVADQNYYYCWDQVLRKAIRYPSGRPKQKQSSKHVRVLDDGRVQATFDDGSTWAVTGLTAEEFTRPEDKRCSAKGRPQKASLWEGSKETRRCRVTWRKDRMMLLSLFEWSVSCKKWRQICQICPETVKGDLTQAVHLGASVYAWLASPATCSLQRACFPECRPSVLRQQACAPARHSPLMLKRPPAAVASPCQRSLPRSRRPRMLASILRAEAPMSSGESVRAVHSGDERARREVFDRAGSIGINIIKSDGGARFQMHFFENGGKPLPGSPYTQPGTVLELPWGLQEGQQGASVCASAPANNYAQFARIGQAWGVSRRHHLLAGAHPPPQPAARK